MRLFVGVRNGLAFHKIYAAMKCADNIWKFICEIV